MSGGAEEFTALHQRYRRRCEAALEARLPRLDEEPRDLHQAMHYACLDGGKRLRAMLVYASGKLLRAPEENLDAAAAAIEMMHAYSLVHDDLPAMDNDLLRRGRPSCHAKFGEATAILAGNALQARAFTALTESDICNPGVVMGMVRTLAKACGSLGMAGGQLLDLEAEAGAPLSAEALQRMHRMKTGALIAASVRLGALAANCEDKAILGALDTYGNAIGLAFQIVDDVLDVDDAPGARGDAARLGKTRGKDEAAHKQTYVSVLGVEEASRLARQLHEEAVASLQDFADQEGGKALIQIADFVICRDH